MSLPYAVIIAGGQGSRLGGVRKADLRIGGRPMLARVAELLSAISAPLMVATGPNMQLASMPAGSVAVVDQSDEHSGPLAGIAAAVAYLRDIGVVEGVLVSAAVDTPLIPHDYVTRLIAALDSAPSAYAGWGAAFYPPDAAWRLEAIADLPERMAAANGPASPKALHQALGGVMVDWQQHGAKLDPFLNINTLDDLIKLALLARR